MWLPMYQTASVLWPKAPGYKVGIKLVYCWSTETRTTFNTSSTPGNKTRSPPVAAETTTRFARPKSKRGVRLHTRQSMQQRVACPRVPVLEIVAQKAPQERNPFGPVAPPARAQTFTGSLTD